MSLDLALVCPKFPAAGAALGYSSFHRHLQHRHSTLEHQFESHLFCFPSSSLFLGKQWRLAQGCGLLHPQGRPSWNFWLLPCLALPWMFDPLGNEPRWNQSLFFFSPSCNATSQINK